LMTCMNGVTTGKLSPQENWGNTIAREDSGATNKCKKTLCCFKAGCICAESFHMQKNG